METSMAKVLSDYIKVIGEAFKIHKEAILTLKERIDDIERKQNEKIDNERS